MSEKIVFCDFDGTITTEDTFVKMLRKFTPDLAEQILPEIYNLRLTLRDGVRQLMESIPSAKYPEILAFMQCEPQRTGFKEFLDFLTARNIKIVIISGGLKGMIEAILGDLKEHIYAIHAFDVDTTKPYLQVKSDYESDTQLVSKVDVIKSYNVQDFIV
jgi:2-hydroxy-3-keto-5-methylthiopentenyl-1-phosphate phosphatase